MATTKKKTAAKSTTRKSAGKTTGKTARKTTKASSRKDNRGVELGLRRLKSVSWISIMEALAIGVFGVLILIDSATFQRLIFYAVGIFLMVKGAYKIVNYFAMHGRFDFYNNDLFYGVIALILGIIAVVLSEQLSWLVGAIVGVWMIYGSLVRLNTAIKLQAAGVKEWFYVLIFALVMMALGIYAIIAANDGSAMKYVGMAMIAVAVLSIIDDFVFMRNIDKLAE